MKVWGVRKGSWGRTARRLCALRLPDTFERGFFAKKHFEAKLNITSLASFSRKKIYYKS